MPKIRLSEKERFVARYYSILSFHSTCPSYDAEDCTMAEDIEDLFEDYDWDTRQDWFEEE